MGIGCDCLLPKSRLPAADEPPAEEAHDDDRGDGDACDGPAAEAALVRAGGHTGLATGSESIVTYTSTFIICGVIRTVGHARAPSRAHLLISTTCLADSVRTAVRAVSHLAIEAFGAGLVELLPFCCAGRARDCFSTLGARLAVSYAPVCCIVAEGADLLLAGLVSGGEVSSIFACSLTNARARSVIALALLEVLISIFTGRRFTFSPEEASSYQSKLREI